MLSIGVSFSEDQWTLGQAASFLEQTEFPVLV